MYLFIYLFFNGESILPNRNKMLHISEIFPLLQPGTIQ